MLYINLNEILFDTNTFFTNLFVKYNIKFEARQDFLETFDFSQLEGNVAINETNILTVKEILSQIRINVLAFSDISCVNEATFYNDLIKKHFFGVTFVPISQRSGDIFTNRQRVLGTKSAILIDTNRAFVNLWNQDTQTGYHFTNHRETDNDISSLNPILQLLIMKGR